MEGEDNASVAPDVGDSVSFDGGGTVTRVEGDNVYFTVDTVNGEPTMKEGMKEMGMDSEERELDQMARGEGEYV